MAFDGDKAELALTGETPLNVQPVHVHIRSDTGEETAALLSFVQTEGETTQSFSLSVPLGLCTLSLIFLPGSNFTFVSMKLDTICKETDAP